MLIRGLVPQEVWTGGAASLASAHGREMPGGPDWLKPVHFRRTSLDGGRNATPRKSRSPAAGTLERSRRGPKAPHTTYTGVHRMAATVPGPARRPAWRPRRPPGSDSGTPTGGLRRSPAPRATTTPACRAKGRRQPAAHGALDSGQFPRIGLGGRGKRPAKKQHASKNRQGRAAAYSAGMLLASIPWHRAALRASPSVMAYPL